MNQEYIALSGSKTQTGKNIEFNSDAIIDFPINGGHVYVVSDGRVGENGHAALAAKLSVDSIKKYFSSKVYKNIINALTNAVSFANYSVFEQAGKDPKYTGMVATIAVLIYYQGKCYYAYAGDSRIYILNKGELKALTKDHLPESDDMAKEEPNVVLGKHKDIKFGVCINPINVELDHKFLVCTDGLTNCLSEQEITEVLAEEDTAVEHQAMLLSEKALAKENEDCFSFHVVDFGSEQVSNSVKEKKSVGSSRITVLALAIIGAVILSFGAYKGFVLLSQPKVEKAIVVEEQVEPVVVAEPSQDANLEVDAEPVIESEQEEINPVVKATPAVTKDESVNQQELFHKHKVKYGENLYRLGLRYNTSQEELLSINGSKASNLVANSYLNIPIKANYVVKAGESWSIVSDKFNVKINSIAKANNIEATQSLNNGQKLIIPLR